MRSTSSPKNSTRTSELLGRRLELERVAADAEPGAAERLVVALVLEVDEVAQDRVAPVLAADPQLEHRRAVVDRRAQAVDARRRWPR